MATVPAADGSILVVCTGNVCRSPLIELLLQHELRGTSIGVISAGTGPIPSGTIDPRTVETARTLGLPKPSAQIPTAVTPELIANADLVLTATRRHRGIVAAMHPAALSYAFAFVDVADLAPHVTVDDAWMSHEAGSHQPTWVALVARAVARERGSIMARPETDVDIVDPYRRSDATFERMVRQVRTALPAVVHLLTRGRSISGTSAEGRLGPGLG